MRFRFLIADMMVLVIPCAVAAFALRESIDLVGEVAFAAFLAALCLASLGAKFRRGHRPFKMFWKGFAAFGWVYFFIGLRVGVGYQGKDLLIHSGIAFTFAFCCAYVTGRVVTKTVPPVPQLPPPPAGPGPAGADVDFGPRSA
ncbi:MAG TPA: hypothetical protein VG406_16325 [Isosphaeraceae bacterium]|jgi:hypothetical protein|nr:hypothetical protein [Isosphaeraceae bacterium]